MAGRKRISEKDRFMEKVSPEPNTGCWLWGATAMKNGYGRFSPSGRKSSEHSELAHRAAYRLFVGALPPSNMDLLHACDNPSCVNPEHLSVGTRADNVRDCMAKGRFQQGTRHYKTKLTDEEVCLVRVATGFQWQIAAKFGIRQSQVSRIKSGVRRTASI